MRNTNKKTKGETMKHDMKIYLVAISGDVSARGMGDTADAILIDKKDQKLVSDFLVAQTRWSTACLLGKPSTAVGNKYFGLQLKLWDAEIFTNKYQARSRWSLEIECDLDLLGFKYEKVEESK